MKIVKQAMNFAITDELDLLFVFLFSTLSKSVADGKQSSENFVILQLK